MNEKPDIDIELNEVVIPKNKQGIYGSKDYLYNLKLFTAHLDPNFGVYLVLSVIIIETLIL